MKQSSFDATISALDAETSALDMETSLLDAETSLLDAETSALAAATSAIARSYRRYRCGVYGDIGDCGVGITQQMCNRVTNHGDMSTFSKPVLSHVPKSGHFLDYLNFGALFDFFLWSICWNLCNLALVKCLLVSSLPNLYKLNIFQWLNYGTKGVDHWVTYPTTCFVYIIFL